MVSHYYFSTSLSGMKRHSKFLEEINKNGYMIVNAWIIYHDYSHSHIAKELHYVIQDDNYLNQKNER